MLYQDLLDGRPSSSSDGRGVAFWPGVTELDDESGR
jgi:hypothetical protein